jgi:hypothetical protein
VPDFFNAPGVSGAVRVEVGVTFHVVTLAQATLSNREAENFPQSLW